MNDVEPGIEIAKLVATIVDAIFVVWYWNREKHKLEEYRCLDATYHEILKAYLEHPRFGQPELTAKYAEAFKDIDFWRYHYSAMRVHTFLESIESRIDHKRTIWTRTYPPNGGPAIP